MSNAQDEQRFEAAYRQAREIIKREWLEAGMTEEEWQRDEQIAGCLDALASAGIVLGPAEDTLVVRPEPEPEPSAPLLVESVEPVKQTV